MLKIRIASLLLIIFGLSVSPLFAQTTTLHGNARTYSGQELVFYQFSDFITQAEEVLARCTVDAKGDFRCDLQIDDITYIFAYLGIYKIYFFAEPGSSYELVLPNHEPKTEAQRLNPFFTHVDLHAGMKNLPSNDLNYLISTFDLAFNENFNQIVQEAYAGVQTISLDSLTKGLEERFASFKHPFFDSYRWYRYGFLSQLALMKQSRSISEEYFQDKPILYNNPSYMELFNLLYDKYFLFYARTEQGSSVFSNITSQRSYTNLKNTLAQDDVLANDSLLELVILKGLHDGFFDDNFSRRALLTILDSVYTGSQIPEHIMIAQNIRSKVTRLLAGFVPTPFELYTHDGKLVSLNDFEGRYVYLNFCSTTSYTCLQEFSLLEGLYERHGDRLEIVTISVDREVEDLKSFLDQTGYSWTFLHYGNKPDIIKDFDVRAFPTYFLIDPDRRLVISPAPSPRENFEMQLFRVLRSRGEI